MKFHWKPLLGVHSVAWDEAQKISGKDPDFHRRDLWEAIEIRQLPGVRAGPADRRGEGRVRVRLRPARPDEAHPRGARAGRQRVGKLTLNRNPDNFFAETEQVAFHIGHVVPGIDFTNDPLLQGRLFSYTDTQLIRLGGPELPRDSRSTGRSLPPCNNQRDGFMRQTINPGRVSYEPNSLGDNEPAQVPRALGRLRHDSRSRSRAGRSALRGASFFDHYSQARMFFLSQSEPEQQHIIKALRFELGQGPDRRQIRERMVLHLAQIDARLATDVGMGLGVKVPQKAVRSAEPERPRGRRREGVPAPGTRGPDGPLRHP